MKKLHGAGIGLRPKHTAEIIVTKPQIDFLEAHSENYFGYGNARENLLELSQYYPVSLHGVGLSLGRADGLDKQHLTTLKRLVEEINPTHISEHLSWSAYSHIHVPDLLPLPRNKESFKVFVEHVNEMQNTLGRQILVENPSHYLAFAEAQIPEPEFLNNLAESTGCGLLLDVNNIYVSATNLDENPQAYIKGIESKYIKQYHLAGYEEIVIEGEKMLLDTHGKPVYQQVWDLYEFTLRTLGTKPTLLEWDADLPELNVLLAEADKIKIHQNKLQIAA